MRFPAASGIAIAPILFVIALLAILATAIAAGSSTFSSGSDQEAARVNASAIIDVATTLRAAVARVTALGCSDTQISFENSVVSGYTNSNAPADYHCHVFHVLGGGLEFPQITASTLETADGGRFVFQGSHIFTGVGRNANGIDLAGFLPVDSLAICQQINKQIGMDGYLGWDLYINPGQSQGRFIGSYSGWNWIADGGGGSWKNGQIFGCLKQGSAGVSPNYTNTAYYPANAQYFFYVVLLAR